ncbi:alpha/beta fold hydrolase [Streptomyces rubradiris]|uniref:Alpha/beta hydrolase n=1 Tax=Streptomyces rubradiris TaxID=285531 RepID=A0ABQ3R8C7_STRRR|nr:alpha/beta fold hydrolase [Streptomyces rubradiris]GHH22987.1 alpha/beta hydrolase [Streptomyces rubradiris]GHI52093.1 alpha/beta hydrolase [Streptomyces rubradiris]
MAYTTVDGIALHYEDLGAGRPLVFLHGWGTSGRVWDAQAADLMADHRVITLDWRGCGRSERPADGYTISRLAGDVLEFVDALGLDRPVMIGSSIAGAFIIEAALAAPDRFGAIIPVDAGVHHFCGRQGAMDKLLAGLRADRAGTLADFVPHWYRPGASTAMIDWTVAQLLESTFRIDGLVVDQAGYDPRERVAALRVPTHFLHGELDTEVPLSVPRELAALIPGSRLTVIDGAGHMAQQDQADRFTAALRAALSDLL